MTYLGTEPSCPGNPVKVGVGVLRHIVVEHDVHTLYVHSSAEQVGRYQDTLLEILKLLISKQTKETNMKNGIIYAIKSATNLPSVSFHFEFKNSFNTSLIVIH